MMCFLGYWYGGYGWWWWLAFLFIFFLLPLGYGWGYRGWGPWYRRRRPPRLGAAPGTEPAAEQEAGWVVSARSSGSHLLSPSSG